jgi:hypothetical protein
LGNLLQLFEIGPVSAMTVIELATRDGRADH